jgi:predicted transglutaminase-like cysteine proteinase
MRKTFASVFAFLLVAFATIGSHASDTEPFGLVKTVAPNSQNTWREWQKIKVNVEAQVRELARCRAEPSRCKPAERRFEAIVKEAKSRRGLERIEFVNQRINGEIRYVPDKAQWGAEDVWSLPIDVNNEGALNKGVGDCEDFALAKYAALHQSGTPDADLRIVVLHDNAVREDHAVLAVRHSKQWLILDNRWNTLLEDKVLKHFQPLFVVEKRGVTLLGKMFRLSDGKTIAPGGGN